MSFSAQPRPAKEPKSIQIDISLRARREQAFKNSLKANFNVNVRQGRTYSKSFNRQLTNLEVANGEEGTCIQYMNHYSQVRTKLLQAM